LIYAHSLLISHSRILPDLPLVASPPQALSFARLHCADGGNAAAKYSPVADFFIRLLTIGRLQIVSPLDRPMASVTRADPLPLTEPMPLDPLSAFRSPNPDIRFTALRHFMLRMGLSLQPVRVDPVPKAPPKPKAQPPSPPASPPKRPPQKTREREFKHALSRGVRHSYEGHIRDISTPDWAASDSSRPPAAIAGDFDICEVHGQLEACEHRIINGLDRERHHPALCVAVAAGLELKPEESEKAERYEFCQVAGKVPTFWPTRVWDEPASQFSEEESKRLGELLLGQGTEFVPKVVKSPVRIRTSHSPQQKVRKTSLLLLDMNNYKTDDSDGDTDWDDL
jgi:hypothetical protein